ncbi:DUF7683 domain-containing protein [Hymenobacter norwichensis]|uniref:DUF7683 domain-containing protein n=1 Tax=Hymenobacter norwichensis TaxID=223903 RepID=UPI0003B2E381|nr:hypothetical protein [Hymenobacter norwichensis]
MRWQQRKGLEIGLFTMKIQRMVSWFRLDTEALAGELVVDHIPLDTLRSIFTPPPTDELLYNPYDIQQREALLLAPWIDLRFEFAAYSYQLDCFQA